MAKKEITREDYEAAYKCGQQVHAGLKGPTSARDELIESGLSGGTATNYIYNLRHMLAGRVYKRAMSVESTDDFLAWIHQDYGPAALRNAISSLEKHIPYFRKSSPSPMEGHVRVLEKYRLILGGSPAENSAIDDLFSKPEGNTSPDRAKRTSMVIIRDPQVRAFVINRADGKCEYCGSQGFILPNGHRYVEAHHIISLANSGYDTIENVIALCASHHREAHFGADAVKLERAFIEKLKLLSQQPFTAP